ncbi:MAG: ATP-binding protein [Mycoplasma sp.]
MLNNKINIYRRDFFVKTNKEKYKREIFSTLYDNLKSSNILLIGLRQVGKTTLMLQLGKQYYEEYIKNQFANSDSLYSATSSPEDSILYLNVKSIIDHTDEMFDEITNPKYKLIMLDEIQSIANWSDKLQAAIDVNAKAKFIISGSNYNAFMKETMVNRIKTFFVQPLSFIDFKNIWNNDSIEEYMLAGSFPKSNEDTTLPVYYEELIEQNIIDKIIIDDYKNTIDGSKFKMIVKKLNDRIGNEIVLTTLEKDFKITRQTITEYIPKMINSRLMHSVSKYKDSNAKSKYKLYYEDKSMIFYFNDFLNLNNNLYGSMVENIIFNYLTAKYCNKLSLKNIIKYYRDQSTGKEIDFIIEDQKLLIECKYCNELDISQLTNEMNSYLLKEIKDYKKILIVKYENKEKIVNGWEIVPLEDILRGEYGL